MTILNAMSGSLKNLFLESATIRSHDKHTTIFLTSGAEILLFSILTKVSAIPKHVSLLNKKTPKPLQAVSSVYLPIPRIKNVHIL